MQKCKRCLLLLLVCSAPALVACGKDDQSPTPEAEVEHFSFFVTSLKALRELSGSEDGFGGDLRFGETGAGAGLRGADEICRTIAETSMPNNGRTWRAFLSATQGEDGEQVDAIDRIGEGPWYDRVGRLVAPSKTELGQTRPEGADAAIVDDLPNEDGIPNHAPDPSAGEVDNHDVLTGTNDQGKLFSSDIGSTCNDWTSTVGDLGQPRCGHSWGRGGTGPNGGPSGGPSMMANGEGGGPTTMGSGGPMQAAEGGAGANSGPLPPIVGGPGLTGSDGSGESWMSALNEAGCAAGAFIVEAGPPGANGTATVGDGGGYGAIYCFALTP